MSSGFGSTSSAKWNYCWILFLYNNLHITKMCYWMFGLAVALLLWANIGITFSLYMRLKRIFNISSYILKWTCEPAAHTNALCPCFDTFPLAPMVYLRYSFCTSSLCCFGPLSLSLALWSPIIHRFWVRFVIFSKHPVSSLTSALL